MKSLQREVKSMLTNGHAKLSSPIFFGNTQKSFTASNSTERLSTGVSFLADTFGFPLPWVISGSHGGVILERF